MGASEAAAATFRDADAGADIARIARAELRRAPVELPRGSDAGAAIARYDAATVGARPGQPWCAYFASWVARAAGHPIGPRGRGIASAGAMAAWARRTGRWSHRPTPGSVLVLPAHVGVVVAVHGARITSVEGNWSNKVSRVERSAREPLGYLAAPAPDGLRSAGFGVVG